jgi:hypothetical protein
MFKQMGSSPLNVEDAQIVKDFLKSEYNHLDPVNKDVFREMLDKLSNREVLFLFNLLEIVQTKTKIDQFMGLNQPIPLDDLIDEHGNINFDDDDDFGEGGDMYDDDDESDFF